MPFSGILRALFFCAAFAAIFCSGARGGKIDASVVKEDFCDTEMVVSTAAFCGRGEDLSPQFDSFMDLSEYYLTPENISRMRKYKIVFVAGLLSDFYKAVKIGGRTFRHGRYFQDQERWLTAAGIGWTAAEIGSQSPPEENARAVAAAVLDSTQPVIIVAHSKGGLDALEALLDKPAVARKTAAFYAVQTPFLGSPVADWFDREELRQKFAETLLNWTGGEKRTLLTLTSYYRRDWFLRRRGSLNRLRGRLRFVCVASWKSDAPGVDTVFEVSRDIMLKRGLGPNDGLVPLDSALLPDCDYALLPETDHRATVVADSFNHFDRAAFMKAVLLLALDMRGELAGPRLPEN